MCNSNDTGGMAQIIGEELEALKKKRVQRLEEKKGDG
jgi:hypothetical protein